MRVFVTGATGFIGSAVVKELLSAGHQVLGLARSEANAISLQAAGAEVHRGDLEDLDSLRKGAAAADGVIHCGFIHDFTRFAEVCEADRRAIEAIGTALAGSDRPFVVTSGTALLAENDGLATEDMRAVSSRNPRIASEQAADAVAALGVRVSVVRLPPSVHGVGDHGFVPILINIARERGASVFTDDGLNRWPAVHRLDAARLYRLALEKVAAPGTRYHGAAEEGITIRQIAEIIGKRLRVPLTSKPPQLAFNHFGWFYHFATIDNPSSSEETKKQLGWKPEQPGLLMDIDQESYFTI